MGETKFVEVFFREYSEVITKNFKTFLDTDLYIDLIFICKNKKKIKAHQIVIGYLSKFLYDIFVDNQYDTAGKVAYICIPDINSEIMERIIRFIYTGQVTLNREDLEVFHEDMKLLGMPSCTFTAVDESITSIALPEFISNTTPETKPRNEISQILLPNATSQSSCNDEQNYNSEQLSNILKNAAAFNSLKSDPQSVKKIARNLFTQLQKIKRTARKSRNNKFRAKISSGNSATKRLFINRLPNK